MFDTCVEVDGGTTTVSPDVVYEWLTTLATGALPTDDGARIGLLTSLERLTSAAASAQARVTVEFERSQRAAQAAKEVPARHRGRGIASQIALARMVSPHQGQQLLGLALTLDRELPHTAAALQNGRISQWRAMIVARESAALSASDRAAVDAEVASDQDALEARGDRALAGLVASLAARIDPESVVARRRKAESDRRVSLRPAPDTMSMLSGLLPVADGVAVSRHSPTPQTPPGARAISVGRARSWPTPWSTASWAEKARRPLRHDRNPILPVTVTPPMGHRDPPTGVHPAVTPIVRSPGPSATPPPHLRQPQPRHPQPRHPQAHHAQSRHPLAPPEGPRARPAS